MPFPTRLTWLPRSHVATRRGVSVQLTEPPDLGAGPVQELDYAPFAFGIIRRSPSSPAEEQMTAAECRAADALLRQFVPSGPVPL